MPRVAIRAPRYINGVYIRASVEHPFILDVPEGEKVDKGMELLDEGGKPAEPKAEKLRPAYAERAAHPQSVPTVPKKKGDSPL